MRPEASNEGMQRSHPVLPRYYADADDKRRFLRKLFDTTAGDYERIDRLLAFGTGAWYRRQALTRAGLASGMQVLDVAVGTGLVAREATRILGERGGVVGIDPSIGMMTAAESPAVALVQGRAEKLPFAAGSFDFVALGYALRHVADFATVFGEFRRVLRPGCRLLMLEITRPEGRVAGGLLKAYLRGVVPSLARLLARHSETPRLCRYYWDTIEACVPPAQVMKTMATAGFTHVERMVQLGIFSEYRACA